jgi:hypothetical protein
MTGWAKGGSVKWIGYYRWLKRKPPGTEPTIDIEDARSYTLLTQTNNDEWLCTRNLSAVMFKFVRALGLKVEEK